jgi:hypothetical protein
MATKTATDLVSETLEILDTGIDDAQPKDGAHIIKSWITQVKKQESLSDIADNLQELHDCLGEKEVDGKKISALLKKLGTETAKAAKTVEDDEQKDSLKDLAESLTEFSKELK